MKEREPGHKWSGRTLSPTSSKNAALDIDYHLQSANRAFFANNFFFLSRNVSIKTKLKFFDAIVTPGACFGAGPRCIRTADMDKFDIHFRRMIRCVVGARGGICWQDPWHEILHIWNQRVREMVEVCHMKTWAETCASQQWKFASYIRSLPYERWVRRMLHWQPVGRGPVGRPAMNWTSKFEQFSRIKRWDDWKNVATDGDQWMMEMGRVCFTVFRTFRTGSRQKQGCLLGVGTTDSDGVPEQTWIRRVLDWHPQHGRLEQTLRTRDSLYIHHFARWQHF